MALLDGDQRPLVLGMAGLSTLLPARLGLLGNRLGVGMLARRRQRRIAGRLVRRREFLLRHGEFLLRRRQLGLQGHDATLIMVDTACSSARNSGGRVAICSGVTGDDLRVMSPIFALARRPIHRHRDFRV
uniref:Uncharacterized protein n=1 Tax=Schlesneria paludicola TaxID=360056 RepID=A0A7C4LJQ6_9PLAN